MNSPAPEQIAKLPKWAQEYVRDLERRREVAVSALNDFVDDQSESPFFVDEGVCTGEESGPSFKRRYIQARGVNILYAGIDARIYLNDGRIEIQWSHSGSLSSRCALVPVSFQKVELTADLE